MGARGGMGLKELDMVDVKNRNVNDIVSYCLAKVKNYILNNFDDFCTQLIIN